MFLFDLIKNTNGRILCGTNARIEGFSLDAKDSENKLFFAMRGNKNDGNNFLNKALSNEAAAIVVECKSYKNATRLEKLPKSILDKIDLKLLKNRAVIATSNIRKFYSDLSRKYFNFPDNTLKIIGVTGTNGKTTTTHIVRDLLTYFKKKVGMIGTNGYFVGYEKIGQGLTTPDSFDFYRYLDKMLKMGVEYVVTELSAHALYLDKLYSMKLDVAAVTNLTRDHLDFFSTMEKYGAAKKKILKMGAQINVINADDDFCVSLAKGNACASFGLFNPSDVFAVNVEYDKNGTKAFFNVFDNIYRIQSPLCGQYNLYNLLCAASIMYKLGFKKDLENAFLHVRQVPGRFNTIVFKDNLVVIDYAHTPDGLEKLLTSVKGLNMGKIITVFGCGGDRDKGKRPLMGKIADEYSDEIILTSDNSRSEKPTDIIKDIIEGISSREKIKIFPSRKEAIFSAVSSAENSAIVIAGKGAETYMEENGKKTYFNDKETVMELLENT